MDGSINAEVLQFVTSVGVSGVLLLWLWDVRAQLKFERDLHERTRQKLEETLKDCNHRLDSIVRDETRRVPVISDSDKLKFQRMIGDE